MQPLLNRLRRGLCAMFVLLVWSTSVGGSLAGQAPPGFQESTYLSNLFAITAFEWAPNGDLWIISKIGVVRVLRAGASTPTIIANLTVDYTGERGLLGLTLDPGFASNGFLYLYYTTPTTPPANRISRFSSVGNALQNETVLLQGPDLVANLHNAGDLEFGTDGLIYASMGDNNDPSMAQRLDSLLGKILRITPNGSIPPSNPFVSDPNARHEILAYGFRNPWRFRIDPASGNLFVGDVGQATWEELDLIIPGANYGWPLTEGPQPAGVSGITYPILYYNHNGGSAAIMAGDFMRTGNFPQQYAGNFFYADYGLNKIVRLVLDAGNYPVINQDFVTQSPGPVHVRVGPDGALYYASNNFETISRLAYVGGANRQPVAVANASPVSGLAPLAVQFDGTASSDPDGTPLTYNWAFGDAATSTAAAPMHSYTTPGPYTATLTVSDGQLTAIASRRIVAGNRPPTATLLTPSNGTLYNAGDTISFSGMGTDPEDGSLGAAALSWTVLFHHQTHIHPYLGPFSGVSSGTFMIADTGEASPEVWYEMQLTATDSGAPLGAAGVLSHSVSINLLPRLATMTFQTAPRADLAFKLDGQPFNAPLAVDGVTGLKRQIESVSPQTPGDGHTYNFAGWSDGGAPSHTMVTPAAATTYTATFNCNVVQQADNLRLSNQPSGDITLTWDTPADICLASGTVYRIYASRTARPLSAPGNFPMDPSFGIVATASTNSVTITPAAGMQYYLVVPLGSDGGEGPVGAYNH